MKTEPHVITLGCRLNTYESELMHDLAKQAGLTDTIIVNTCTVTSEADRQARQTIRKLRRQNPAANIIVSGCAAQIDPEKFAAMPEVDRVLGNQEKLNIRSYQNSDDGEKILVADIMQAKEVAGHLLSGFETRSRAFVQIQQGCDHRCTFCIIPFGRGVNRSVPFGVIAQQMNKLTDAGYKEAVLTGVDISSYGGDLPGQPTLGQMARRLLDQAPALQRLRLSSLDPAAIDDDLIALLAEEPRLMPHIHLSVQTGSDLILKRMKRRHTAPDVVALCRQLREVRPETAFGADLIAGFPTESDAMHQETLALIDEAKLTYLHVFPYSPRPGTPAADMPQVNDAVRKSRAAEIRAKGDNRQEVYFNGLIGATASLLVERGGKGYTETYAPASLENGKQNSVAEYKQGDIVPVTITGLNQGSLTAEINI